MSNNNESNNPNNTPEESRTSFTVDAERTQASLPSITKLLNRKSLKSSSTVQTQKQPETAQKAPEAQLETPINTKENSPADNNISLGDITAGSLPAFTINNTNTSGAPSVNNLLQRQSLELPNSSTSLEVTLSAPLEAKLASIPMPAMPGSISIPLGTTAQPVTIKTSRNVKKHHLFIWTLNMLKTGNDPLGKGLLHLIENGVSSALYMSIQSPLDATSPPFFASKSAFIEQDTSGEKLIFWEGLKWDPMITPEVWNSFIKNGHLEFSPPGTSTYQKSPRNIIRGAFGIQAHEWLLLLRVGPADACRGILSLVSNNSVVHHLEKALPLISSVPDQNQRAA